MKRASSWKRPLGGRKRSPVVGSREGDKGGSHTLGGRGRRPGEAGQAQRNRLEVGRGSVLGSAGSRGQSRWGPEMPPVLWWEGASLAGSPAGLQAQPWHLDGESRRWVGACEEEGTV